ncbi:hypothetical protein [Mycobacterium sp.]|uniref:hypothetical protein n=1 Tax=Mycobacterium sp. TaxID=1785 RepID=UPI003A8B2A28
MKKIINNIKKSLKGTNKKVVIPIVIIIVVVIGVGTYFIPNFNEYQALQTQTKLLGLNYPQTNILVKDSTIEKMKEDIFNSQQELKETEKSTKKSSSDDKESKSNSDKQSKEDTDKGNSTSSNSSNNNSNNNSSSSSSDNSSSSNDSNSNNGSSSSGGNNLNNNGGGSSSEGNNSNNNGGGSSSGGNNSNNNGGGTGVSKPDKPTIPSEKKCGYISKSEAEIKAADYLGVSVNDGTSSSTEYGYDCISDFSFNGTSWVPQYKYDMPAYVLSFNNGKTVMVMGNGTIYDY